MAIIKGEVFGDTLVTIFTTDAAVFDNTNLNSEMPLLKIYREGSDSPVSDLDYDSIELGWSERVSGGRMRLNTGGGSFPPAHSGDTGTFATYDIIFYDVLEED